MIADFPTRRESTASAQDFANEPETQLTNALYALLDVEKVAGMVIVLDALDAIKITLPFFFHTAMLPTKSATVGSEDVRLTVSSFPLLMLINWIR